MKTYNDCIPCLVRQALGAARFISNDEGVHQKVLKKTLVALAAMDMNQSPPMMARHIQNTITEVTFVVRGGVPHLMMLPLRMTGSFSCSKPSALWWQGLPG